MDRLTRVHANNLVKWAKDKPEVLVLSADLTGSTEIDLFRETYPDRFLSMGIAEQNMLSFAGGLAREGFRPFVHTFAVFIYRRAYDQIAMSVAYPNLPVRLFGFLPGITTPGGATHQAIEDIAVMRALPNMTVLECADATDVETCLDAMQGLAGPVYVRMPRGEIPRLFPANQPLRLGAARVLSRGQDITLLSSGICTEQAMRVQALLAGKGLAIRHLGVSTLKPFGDPEVLEAVAGARLGVIAMENHSVIGGLGSAAADLMSASGIGKKVVRLGLPDVFAHGASTPYLMREYGIDGAALLAAVEGLIGQKFDIPEEELTRADRESPDQNANVEAL